MYKKCTTEKGAKRQLMIGDELIAMMLVQKFEEVSVADLCRRLDISRRAFYRYFDTKDDVLSFQIDRMLIGITPYLKDKRNHTDYSCEESESQNAEKSRNRALQELVIAYDYWMERKNFLDALQKSGLSTLFTARFMELSPDIFEDWFPSLEIFDQEHRDTTVQVAADLFLTFAVMWHHDGYRVTSEEVAGITYRILTNPLFKPEF